MCVCFMTVSPRIDCTVIDKHKLHCEDLTFGSRFLFVFFLPRNNLHCIKHFEKLVTDLRIA